MGDLARFPRRLVHTWRVVPLAAFVCCLVLALLVAPAPVAAQDDTENVTVYETENITITDAETIEAAIANGSFELAGGTVVGETLVVAIESERLAATLEAENESTTEQFFAALDGDAEFHIRQTNHGNMGLPKVARVSPENMSVYHANAMTYVRFDTATLELQYPDQSHDYPPPKIRGREKFAVIFGYQLDELSESRSWGDPKNHEFQLYWNSSEFSPEYRGSGRYAPLPPERITRTVEVNIEPEQSLIARVTLETNRTITAPVEPVENSNYWEVVLNLRGVEPETEYALELVHDGTIVDRRNGTVLEPKARVTDARLMKVDGQTAVRVTVMLTHGGFVEVLNPTCEEDMDGGGPMAVDPGVETRMTLELVNERGTKLQVENLSEYGVTVRALRAEGDGKKFYHGPSATATVNFDGNCPMPTETTVPLTTTETTTTGTISTTAAPTTRAESPGQPGFGIAASAFAVAALVALFGKRTRYE